MRFDPGRFVSGPGGESGIGCLRAIRAVRSGEAGGSEIFPVPAPGVREGVVDIDMLGGDVQLVVQDVADGFGHLLAQSGLGLAEQLHLYHGDGDVLIPPEPHPGVVGKAEHQPVLAFAGEERNGLAQLLFDGGLLPGADAGVGLGVNKRHVCTLTFGFPAVPDGRRAAGSLLPLLPL